MKSTDYNINTPMKVDTIVPPRIIDETLLLREDTYELLTPKDPHTLYIVENESSGERTYYLGDRLIDPSTCNPTIPKYLMGPSLEHEGEFIIYRIMMTLNEINSIQVATFTNIEDAVKCMILYNRIGSHLTKDKHIYSMIKSYIDGLISAHDLIIGIISEFGFRNYPELQQVIQIAISYDVLQSKEDIPLLLREHLHTLKDHNGNLLIGIYSDLYDWLVKYNFFKDKKYQKESLCLASEIDEINGIFVNVDRNPFRI